ncbi:MAG: hypothetical protein ACI8XB_003027 [Patiriisocius sp.]|jgi:uncharacterized protein (TIGR00730 family)
MKSIVVFCGSSLGSNPEIKSQAQELAKIMANANIQLIYGGAKIGIMGAIADEVLKNNGNVVGVIPKFLSAREVAHENLTNLIVVDSMHERKTKMSELGEGFIALPGGYGTLEELFEIVTWAQLGLHQKPIGILNVDGYYDAIVEHINVMVNNGFMTPENKELILVDDNVNGLLSLMINYKPKPVKKWISNMDQI